MWRISLLCTNTEGTPNSDGVDLKGPGNGACTLLSVTPRQKHFYEVALVAPRSKVTRQIIPPMKKKLNAWSFKLKVGCQCIFCDFIFLNWNIYVRGVIWICRYYSSSLFIYFFCNQSSFVPVIVPEHCFTSMVQRNLFAASRRATCCC